MTAIHNSICSSSIDPDPEQPSFFSPVHSTRALRNMARELSNSREGRSLPASESNSSTYANPPLSPDHSRDGSPAPSDSRATGYLTTDASNLSLSVNYLPSKFSTGMLAGGGSEARRRPAARDSAGLGVPKMGGGVDVFKSGEARMGGEGDGDDDDASAKNWFVRGRREHTSSYGFNKKLRWNKFKWILFISNTIVSLLLSF